MSLMSVYLTFAFLPASPRISRRERHLEYAETMTRGGDFNLFHCNIEFVDECSRGGGISGCIPAVSCLCFSQCFFVEPNFFGRHLPRGFVGALLTTELFLPFRSPNPQCAELFLQPKPPPRFHPRLHRDSLSENLLTRPELPPEA